MREYGACGFEDFGSEPETAGRGVEFGEAVAVMLACLFGIFNGLAGDGGEEKEMEKGDVR